MVALFLVVLNLLLAADPAPALVHIIGFIGQKRLNGNDYEELIKLRKTANIAVTIATHIDTAVSKRYRPAD